MGILSMRLDDDLDAQLSREAERENRTRSELVREALGTWLRERERQRFIAEIARAARNLDAAGSRAIAEEAVAYDNEALRAADPRAAYRARRATAGRKR
jgi:predicted transcriptional regulator